MRLSDAEFQDAVKFWTLTAIGLFACVVMGREIVEFASPALTAAVLGAFVALLTLYSPKIALGLLVFAMLLSPKIQGAQLADTTNHGNILVRFDDVLLIIIFFAWLGRTALLKGTAFLVGTPVNMPIFLYTSVYVVSTGFSIMRGDITPLRAFFYLLKYVEYFFLFFMTVNIAENEEDMRWFLWCGWLTAIIVTIYGYWQIPGGQRVTAPFEDPIGTKVKGAGEANTLGGYYIVIFGFLSALYTQGSLQASFLGLGSLIFMLPPFAMTLSRSSYTALMASLSYLLYAAPRRRLTLFMGIGFVAIMLFSFETLRERVIQRVMYTFTAGGDVSSLFEVSLGPLGHISVEESTMDRIWSWQRILFQAFPKHPILGSGVTAVGLVDAQFPLVLGEAGLVGLTLFFWTLYRVWFVASRLFLQTQSELQRVLAIGLMTGLVGLLVQAMGTNTFIIVRIMEPFWFLTALVSRCYVNLAPHEQTEISNAR